MSTTEKAIKARDVAGQANALIGSCPGDTLRNCASVASFLAGIDFDSATDSDDAAYGLSLTLFAMRSALKFECDYVEYGSAPLDETVAQREERRADKEAEIAARAAEREATQ